MGYTRVSLDKPIVGICTSGSGFNNCHRHIPEMIEIAIATLREKLSLSDEAPADKPTRKPIPDHIPRVEVDLTPGTAECGHCCGKLRRLVEEVAEGLEYVPGRFVVNRIVRPRLACSGCDCFTQAPLPSRPIERGRPGPGLLAHVLVNNHPRPLPDHKINRINELLP